MIRNCKICGAAYNTCYSCEKERSWRLHTDTHEHYYIWSVLMEYQVCHNVKQAYNALRKRGVELRNPVGYLPSVEKTLMEIYAAAHENSKARRAVPEVEAVATDVPLEIDTQQE